MRYLIQAALIVFVLAQTMPSHSSDDLPRGKPIYAAKFLSAAQTNFLQDNDRVVGVSENRVAKAYPWLALSYHHIISDRLDTLPILVTWCAMCNTAMVFRADSQGKELTFDNSGLRRMNLTMRDRQTGSRWQQATGEAFEGLLKGKRLKSYPFLLTTWKEWRTQHPMTVALTPEPSSRENYQRFAERTQKQLQAEPSQRSVRKDSRLPALELVMGLEAGGAHRAYPLAQLKQEPVINDQVGTEPVPIVYEARSETTTAFSRRLAERVLTFRALESNLLQLKDVETGSVWTIYGECTRGPLKGQRLTFVTPLPSFRFSWAQFFPPTDIYTGASK